MRNNRRKIGLRFCGAVAVGALCAWTAIAGRLPERGGAGRLPERGGAGRLPSSEGVRIALIAEACQTNGMVTARRTVTDAVSKAGFVPLVLADAHESQREDALLDRVDALVIFGSLAQTDSRRGAFEKRLILAASRRRLPVVGFCHGLQVINKAFGGTVVHNPTNAAERVVHHGKESPYVRDCFHSVLVKEGSLTARALGAGEQRVNTSHNWCIGKLAKGFEVTARAKDGVIEAIEHRTLPVVAFQFHPERLSPSDGRFLALIRAALEGSRGREKSPETTPLAQTPQK